MRPAPGHYPARALIDAYGSGGFRFADMSHRGSLLIVPSGIYAWDVATLADVTLDNCRRLLQETHRPGFVLFGTGASQEAPPSPVHKAFAEAGIALESMSTGAATRTYNVLLAEGREVSAALIAVE